MKIVFAFDSFKGSLPAGEACREAADAIRSVLPGAELSLCPMADGGEGTADALLAARGGEWVPVPATGPLSTMTVDAGYAWLPEERVAIVEMASASGLTLLRDDERNPMRTSTLGTGELLASAATRDPRRILLAVGGSATVDGGMGAAHALGWRFQDANGAALAPCGAALPRIARVLAPEALRLPPIQVLADVDNPLCGSDGAARVFGPQKGASPDMVELLDAGLDNLAAHVADTTGVDMRTLRGGGAAGGLAAGAVAMLRGCIVPGIDTVMDAVALDQNLTGADWVVTGEGSFDEQSLRGKVVSGILRRAGKRGVRVAVLAGRVALTEAQWRAAGVSAAAAITPRDMPLSEAMARARECMAETARSLARTIGS